MRAILINPFDQTVEDIDIPNGEIGTIYEQIGVEGFDISRLGGGVVAFVDDTGLKRKGQRYWCFNAPGVGVLMAGKGLLLSISPEGETSALADHASVEMTRRIVKFIGDATAVEKAIAEGLVTRPTITVNDRVIWLWTPSEEKL